MSVLFYPISVLAAYMIGSIPIGVIATRLLKGVEIQGFGSGRTGATNVYRVAGTWGAALTSLGDAVKGILAVWISGALTGSPWAVAIASIGVVAGHNWSIFLKFRGGAGTATTLGVLAAMNIYVAVVLIALMIIVLVASRTASISSITVALAMGLTLVIFAIACITPWPYVLFGVVAGAMTIYALRPNIKRLLNGSERQLKADY